MNLKKTYSKIKNFLQEVATLEGSLHQNSTSNIHTWVKQMNYDAAWEKKQKKTKQRLLLSRLVIYITSVAMLNLHLLKCHTELCYYNKPMVSPLARGSMLNTTKVISLTLCWKKDGSRYLSNLSSNFTSDFFHFTWIGEVHWHLCMCLHVLCIPKRV